MTADGLESIRLTQSGQVTLRPAAPCRMQNASRDDFGYLKLPVGNRIGELLGSHGSQGGGELQENDLSMPPFRGGRASLRGSSKTAGLVWREDFDRWGSNVRTSARRELGAPAPRRSATRRDGRGMTVEIADRHNRRGPWPRVGHSPRHGQHRRQRSSRAALSQNTSEDIGARPLDGKQGLHHGAGLVQPAGPGGGFDHAVLAAHLIGGDW